MKNVFTRKIIEWHTEQNKRIMPWKGEKDPYKVWIREVILQQTRVLQGLEYYNKFIKEFPTVASLASAKEEAVFKVWEGLGYYSRCKNLIHTSKYIYENLGGNFPDNYEKIIDLKGIGPYTAAAISSFAYGLPHAVVDGNVLRVLARYFGEAMPVDSTTGKKYFKDLASELLFKDDSPAYNQAIMDFGATVCKPLAPVCGQCVLNKHCIAFKNKIVNKLPVKEKSLNKKKRWFTYFVFNIGSTVLINKRTGKDIWQSLHEFYLFETSQEYFWDPGVIKNWLQEQLDIKKYRLHDVSPIFKQQLTHQDLQGQFIDVRLPEVPMSLRHFLCIPLKDLSLIAFPKLINRYLQQKGVQVT